MIEALQIFNNYYKYIYIPILLALLVVLIYLIITIIKMLPNLNMLKEGTASLSLKTNNIKKSTDQIQLSLNKNMPYIMGTLGILSFFRLSKKAMKTRKKNNKESSIVSSIIKEYTKEKTKSNNRKQIINAAKTIGPIINTTRKMIIK